MRVALVTFYPREADVVPGGIRAVAQNLVRAFQGYEGLELHVIHCHSDVAEDRLTHEGKALVHYLATPRRRLIPNLVTSVRRVRRVLRAIRPDVVHAHAAHFAYAAVKAGYPTIYTIHGVLPREVKIYNRTLYDRLRYGLLAHYERQALRRVRQVVAISEHVLREYAPLGTAGWIRVDNPVSPEFFDLADHTVEGRVLYVGSIDERKDLLTLLRALERLRAERPVVRLIVAGRVNNAAYERQVREYVSAHGLTEWVDWRGFLERPALLAEYEHAAVVALSSLEENAPMAVIEAMAAGKPVVATAVGGVPDIVVEGETGFLVSPGDDEALARRLRQVLGDASLRNQLGRRAREVARERFHVQRIARQYYELYQRVKDA